MKALTFAAALLLAGHVRAAELPNRVLTPGAARLGLTVEQICVTKWSRDLRHVTAAMKAETFRRYGYSGNDDRRCIPDERGRRCEIDHLVPRELGGADILSNLWPEPYGGRWNATIKDRLENRLHKLVCSGELDLEKAQRAIAEDWIAAYRRYVQEGR